jgi:SOS-response transcriptional repressor LexA
MDEFDHTGFSRRLRQRLEELGMSPRAASLQAGGSADLVRGILRGANKSVRGDHLVGLARVLQVPESWLITGTINARLSPLQPGPDINGPPEDFGVPFGGVVEAGAWRVVDTMNQDGEYRRVPLAPDPRYPLDKQFAFLVAGDSMNKARIFEGMHVLAVAIDEWEKRHRETTDGQIVVVECLRNGGHERERTIKRLRVFRDRVELQPESDNPLHEPIVLNNGDEELGRVVAVALTAAWVLT